MGESTLSGESPEGWFIPYRHAAESDGTRVNNRLEKLFRESEESFRSTLGVISGYSSALLDIGEDDPAPNPRWNQDWFAGLDAAAAYAMVRHHAPERIVEVGSGHSTRFMVRAIQDGGLSCTLTAIDPAPRADISALPIDLHQSIVQKAPLASFAELQSGDVLFIDSSHILMPGTDVDLLFGEIIPALPAGVIVHVHDIFLPFPYPPEWELRGYNEQNALAPLISGSCLLPLLPNQYVVRRMEKDLESLCGFIPRPRPNHDASIWLIRT